MNRTSASGVYPARGRYLCFKLIFFPALMFFLCESGRAGTQGNWALGGLYPGVALKYITSGKSAWELRAQAGSGVLALGPRYYRYFTKAANPRLFFGIEADSLTYKAADSKGAGIAAGAFVGGEVFLTRHIGLLVDLGPMYLNLEDDKFPEAASGIEYVLNLGLYWHFK